MDGPYTVRRLNRYRDHTLARKWNKERKREREMRGREEETEREIPCFVGNHLNDG
jgi:hypothetical protein